MNLAISHDRREETLEAKARWFQTLSVGEREDLLCYFTDMIFEINPKIWVNLGDMGVGAAVGCAIDRRGGGPIR